MASDKNKAESFNEDDIELGNLDDELDDVSWSDIEDDFDADDFNDDFERQDQDDVGASDSLGSLAAKAPKKKGKGGIAFIGLGALCLVAGGLYVGGLTPFSSKKPIPSTQLKANVSTNANVTEQAQGAQQAAVATEQGIQQDALPMPMPQSEAQDVETSGAQVPSQQPGALQEDTVEILTPMPAVGDMNTIELSSLDEVEMSLSAGELTEAGDAAEALTLDQDLGEQGLLQQVPEEAQQIVAQQQGTSLEEEKLLTETEKTFFPEGAATEGSEELSLTLEEDGGNEVENITEELTLGEADVPAPAPTQPEELILPVESTVSQEEKNIEGALTRQEEQTAEAIVQEKKVVEQEASASKVETAAPTKPETTKQQDIVKPKPLPVWKLRSARPGSAVIYDSRSGEMKTIEVGDTVVGVGKVKSISVVGGKWVVQGTQGKIAQ